MVLSIVQQTINEIEETRRKLKNKVDGNIQMENDQNYDNSKTFNLLKPIITDPIVKSSEALRASTESLVPRATEALVPVSGNPLSGDPLSGDPLSGDQASGSYYILDNGLDYSAIEEFGLPRLSMIMEKRLPPEDILLRSKSILKSLGPKCNIRVIKITEEEKNVIKNEMAIIKEYNERLKKMISMKNLQTTLDGSMLGNMFGEGAPSVRKQSFLGQSPLGAKGSGAQSARTSSGASKMLGAYGSGFIARSMSDVVDRLIVTGSEIEAGNSSIELRNEFVTIIDFLLKEKEITKGEYKKLHNRISRT
jgi:hypothetical protein